LAFIGKNNKKQNKYVREYSIVINSLFTVKLSLLKVADLPPLLLSTLEIKLALE
jgi:hypothetical protein